MALCCGGPLIIALVASAGISGAVVGNLLPVAGLLVAAAFLVGGGIWLARRRGADCCAVPPSPLTSKKHSEGLPR